MSTILIVEDEETFRRSLTRHLSRRGHRVIQAGTCAEAVELIDEEPVDVVLADVVLPDGQGFQVFDRLRQRHQHAHVVVMTGQSALDHAITALREGAADFLTKPFSMEALDASLERVAHMAQLSSPLPPPAPDSLRAWREEFAPEMIGEDPKMLKVYDIIRRVADTDCSVLITGDTGTGKELVAQALHRSSPRQDAAYVAINCAAIPENLMESELFGHAKGAFTGATTAHQGRFAVAHKGTLLLDEIGEMHLPLQAKLLRVLQEGEVRPVGDAKSQRIDVRVIAATNRNVEDMAEAGEFREDLLYRLDVIRIDLPSLRERAGDIPLLVDHFLEEISERRGREVQGIDAAGMKALQRYHWPGNIRQLRHTLERMVVLASDGLLTLDDVPRRIRDAKGQGPTGEDGSPILPEEGLDLKDAVENFENALILQALERTGWNKNQAANILQMNRTTLVEKLKKRGWRKSQYRAA
jgi:DNA-binding NtrC family response regulator